MQKRSYNTLTVINEKNKRKKNSQKKVKSKTNNKERDLK